MTLVEGRVHEGLCRDGTDITAADHLKWSSLEQISKRGRKDLAHKVGCEIVVEHCWAQDGPVHLPVLGLRHEMFLNVMLVGEMGDVCRIVDGLRTVTVDRGVNKMLDAVLESFVNQTLALNFLSNLASHHSLQHKCLGVSQALLGDRCQRADCWAGRAPRLQVHIPEH